MSAELLTIVSYCPTLTVGVAAVAGVAWLAANTSCGKRIKKAAEVLMGHDKDATIFPEELDRSRFEAAKAKVDSEATQAAYKNQQEIIKLRKQLEASLELRQQVRAAITPKQLRAIPEVLRAAEELQLPANMPKSKKSVAGTESLSKPEKSKLIRAWNKWIQEQRFEPGSGLPKAYNEDDLKAQIDAKLKKDGHNKKDRAAIIAELNWD